MLISDTQVIGQKLRAYRKKAGLTQAELAEAASLADRTYADIERGTANMRVSTLLKICEVLRVTPDDLLTEKEQAYPVRKEELLRRFDECSSAEKDTMLDLLSVYLGSVRE